MNINVNDINLLIKRESFRLSIKGFNKSRFKRYIFKVKV